MAAPEAVIEVVDAAAALAAGVGRSDLVARLGQTRERLADDRVRVLVIGEFKQGKSQLVNALVRARVCPVDDDIATSVPTAVRWGQEPSATLVKVAPAGGSGDVGPDAPPRVERVEIPVEELGAHVSEVGNPANREGLTQVEVALPAALLEAGLELVDTPGVGGLGSVRATAILAALPAADAVLLVSSAAQEYTAAELAFCQHAVKLCPNLTCVLTKVDLYPEWRRILALNAEHLARVGVTANVIPVSSTLRWHALDRDDNGLNIESGFPVLVTLLARIVDNADLLTGRVVANSVRSVTEQLLAGASAELGVAEHPETVNATIRELTEAKARIAALRDRSARWQQTLADGAADLSSDIDYDLRDRLREISRRAEEEIDALGDPAVVWVEFAPWVEELVAAAASANFVWTHERAHWLAAQVAEHFAEDGNLALPDLELVSGTSILDEIRPMTLDGEPDPGVADQTLTAVRGGYIGTLMFGMFSTVAGLALLNPFSVGAGLLLGGRTLRDEKKRLLTRRQIEAKTAVRRYIDDVIFHVGKDSRDLLRRLQRQLRDHFTALAVELETSLANAMRIAEAAARADAAQRGARIEELREQLVRIGAVEAAATALVDAAASLTVRSTVPEDVSSGDGTP